jgi:hypothetical protein
MRLLRPRSGVSTRSEFVVTLPILTSPWPKKLDKAIKNLSAIGALKLEVIFQLSKEDWTAPRSKLCHNHLATPRVGGRALLLNILAHLPTLACK